MIDTITLLKKFDLIKDYWNPHIVAFVNGFPVKLAKLKGEFIWHKHDNEDQLFYVVKGKLYILLEDKTLELNEGELAVVPKGVDHLPKTNPGEEAWIMLFEPPETVNTGNLENERTKKDLKII